MNRGAWIKDKKRVPKRGAARGFRLIRAFTEEHNLSRFRTYVDELGKQLKRAPSNRKFRLRIKRQSRNEKALYLAQQPDTGRGDGNHLAASIATS
ncbi:MAG: hypothetical protein HY836_12115 [Aquabacterium sp.]|uniref:hypothetical protein n=1 Tax=Aquabacterium sp. TaxID=1872578 RepID=UPI0025BA227E|nr:hypothetical protein [Aquabacterium sp.]MBI5926334.1 hypothetical protein [Aquabacterium sp.]